MQYQCAGNEHSDGYKMSGSELVVLVEMSEGKSADPYKLESPGGEDIDILSTMIPEFNFAVSTPPSSCNNPEMEDNPENWLKYLLSPSS